MFLLLCFCSMLVSITFLPWIPGNLFPRFLPDPDLPTLNLLVDPSPDYKGSFKGVPKKGV